MSEFLEKSQQLQASTEALLVEAKGALASTDRFFLEQGVDPVTVRNAIHALSSDEISADITSEYSKLEKEMEQEESRLRSSMNAEIVGAGNKTTKRFRPMV
jgi:cell division septum initiation protein DivIVA